MVAVFCLSSPQRYFGGRHSPCIHRTRASSSLFATRTLAISRISFNRDFISKLNFCRRRLSTEIEEWFFPDDRPRDRLATTRATGHFEGSQSTRPYCLLNCKRGTSSTGWINRLERTAGPPRRRNSLGCISFRTTGSMQFPWYLGSKDPSIQVRRRRIQYFSGFGGDFGAIKVHAYISVRDRTIEIHLAI